MSLGTPLLLAVLLAWGGVWARRVPGGPLGLLFDHPVAQPEFWPDVVAVVPARDEAVVIARSIGSLLAQDYPGSFRIILVDDHSTDGTGETAQDAAPHSSASLYPRSPEGQERSVSCSGGNARRAEGVSTLHPTLTVLTAPPLAPGWTGKLAAVAHGIAHAGEPRWLWLTDADIAHRPDSLRALVAHAEAAGLVLNSRMALLRTANMAERAIVPAFVYFFDMLYPFGRVNTPASRIAAAAGGCMLVRADALAAAGGVAAIRRALIDDVAMGQLLKPHGPIRLALTRTSISLRPYNLADLWRMISRSAYAQLGFSPLLLLGSMLGMLTLFWGLALVAIHPKWLLLAAFALCATPFLSVLRVYRLSPLRILLLPPIALFFTAATLASAVQHWRGRGGMWKGRAQAMPA